MRLHSTTIMLVFVPFAAHGPLGAARLVILAFVVFERPLYLKVLGHFQECVWSYEPTLEQLSDGNSVSLGPKERNYRKKTKRKKRKESSVTLKAFFAVDYLDWPFLFFAGHVISSLTLFFFLFLHLASWEHIHLLMLPITVCLHGHKMNQRECIVETCQQFRGTNMSSRVRSQTGRSPCPRVNESPLHCRLTLHASSKHSQTASQNFHVVSQQHCVTENSRHCSRFLPNDAI